MKIEGYVVLQSVGKKNLAIKGDGIRDYLFTVYREKEDAREFLKLVLANVKKEMGQGVRTSNNLNPEESLDFYIEKVTVELPLENVRKRGWQI